MLSLCSATRSAARSAFNVSVRCMSSTTADVVVLDYEELQQETTPDLLNRIEKAYGYDGLGLLAVRDVPEYSEKRKVLLPMARELAHLPEEELLSLEHPESFYSFGWSHGKEMMSDGKPDISKGSFYANPLYDNPVDDPELIEKYVSFYHANIWPSNSMPHLEPAFKDLGRLIVDVGRLVAVHCDALVRREIPSYPDRMLHNILVESRMCKARLLHYYAPPEGEGDSDDDWCGWHNDHGSLTGLANAMFHDETGAEIPCPDDKAGLYIKSRQGDTVRVVMPPGCMAFQIGETAQVHSGGVLQATPHSVQASAVPGVSRSTLAVFMEPEVHFPMSVPDGADADRVLRGAGGELLPPGVPALATRWNNDQTFAEFTDKTLASYH